MTSPNDLKLGFAVPIFANPGVVDVRTPSFVELEWAPILNGVIEAEKLGYDSLWVADHMFLGRDGAILESWTTLSALAGATSTIRLGNIHLGNGFRPPALTAKMISTLDFISGGRFDLFIDPGWREREHTAYGYQWEPDRSIRARQVGEAVELFKAMWTGDPTSFAGEFYRVDGAINTPAPTRAGGPEITIGEAFDDATLDLVARHADCWNSMPAGVDVLAQKIAAVDQACSQRGRDPATLRKTLETQVLILDDSTQWDDWLEKWSTMLGDHPVGDAMTDFFEFVHAGNPQLAEGVNSDRLREEFVIGTRAEVAEKLAAYHDLGISEVICWFMDFPSGESMRALARDVRPKIGANHG